MNEKQFLEKINNYDKVFICRTVSELLREQEDMIDTYKKTSILRRLFGIHKKQKTAQEIISDNFETILRETRHNDIASLLKILIKCPETQKLVRDKFDIILTNAVKNENLRDYDIFNIFRNLTINMKQASDFFYENIDNILNIIPKKYLFSMVQALRGLSCEIDTKLNVALEENKVEVCKSFLNSKTAMQNDNTINGYSKTLSIMIDELLKSENRKMIDIKNIGKGDYCTVYQIGNKVLKIGSPRETYNIPNHPRILQPLTRTNFINENNKMFACFACIEISDRVEMLAEKEKSIEKLYKLWKELRKEGIIWTDAKFENVGKLIKPNIPTLNGEKINVAPNSVGFQNAKEDKDLTVGDWVVIDTDYIYTEDSFRINWAR